MNIKELLAFPHLRMLHIAYDIACEAHAKDKRNDGKTPYMHHVDAVIENTYKLLASKEREGKVDAMIINTDIAIYVEMYLVVAALHDVVEDHEDVWPMRRIVDEFDKAFVPVEEIELVVDGVFAITKKAKGVEPYISYVLRVKNNRLAKIVKLADLEHNMSDLKPGNMLDKYSVTKYLLEQP